MVKIKKHVKKYRKVPDFDPLPASLRSLRGYISPTVYARFYGNFITITGKLRRFSFQVKLDAGLSGQEMERIVRTVSGALKQNRVPRHEPGQIFGFDELFDQTHWVEVRRVTQYDVDVRS